MITVSLQEKNGIYQAVLNYKDDTGKRKQKWKSTGITIKNNKKLALIKAIEFRLEFEKNLNKKNENYDSKTNQETFFVDYMKKWLKIIKPTIKPNTFHKSIFFLTNLNYHDI